MTEIYKKSLQLLALREHSRYELQQKLLSRGYVREEIDVVLDRLKQERLQSDERFAESYLHARSSRGYGPERIRLELQQKGIDEVLTQQVMQLTQVDWKALAQKVYTKKFGKILPNDLREKIKRQQFMRYRGFLR